MKTAMQILYSDLERVGSSVINKSAIPVLLKAISGHYLEIEKQQIIDAYHIPHSNIRTKEEGEKYYNNTFKDQTP
jgi:hypothetical protein